jgi:arsenate reductase
MKQKEAPVTLPNSKNMVLLLHNPKCSKSRAALDLLRERGVDAVIRLYLEDPLDREELEDLGRRLGRSPIEFARPQQAEFKQAGLSRSSSDEAILKAMVTTPILMERPILVRGERAAIGRPPEDILRLLED